MTFGNFHPDALEALNLIFACAAPLLSVDRLFNNNNNNEEMDEMMNSAEIEDANEFFARG